MKTVIDRAKWKR